MADMDERVTKREREVASLKTQVQRHEGELVNIPELIRVEARLTRSQIARLAEGHDALQTDFDAMRLQFGRVQQPMEAMPRVVAEIVTQLLDERERRCD